MDADQYRIELFLIRVYPRSSAVSSSDFIHADVDATVGHVFAEEILRDGGVEERRDGQAAVDQLGFAGDAVGGERYELVGVADGSAVAGVVEARVALISSGLALHFFLPGFGSPGGETAV